MKKNIAVLVVCDIFLVILVALFYLPSFLLTRELSSDEKVNEIISQKDQLTSYANYAIFNNEIIPTIPDYKDYLAQISEREERVLGEISGRWIEINLSQQKLYTHEGNSLVNGYLISSGKWAPTPTGNFNVWIKLPSTLMHGGSKELGTYYYLPNVPCTMYFYKGYGIHGTYWHNNFGHPMSHGCVNMRTPDACEVYNFSSVGTPVNIHN
jgi:hypothetical protein